MALNEYLLGELITQRREKKPENENLPILGVSKDGFIPPKQIDADTDIYNVFYKNDFVYNPARMELGSIAFNDKVDKGICSSLYEMFYVHRTDLVLPEFLALFVGQEEFARYCNFLSSGSAREYCRFINISQIKITLPPIEEQRKIVHDYKVITDRVELLKKINENLEEQVFSLYNDKTKDIETTCKIIDLGEFVRGKNITSDEMIPGKYEVVSAGLEPSGMHNEFNVKGPSISISASGVNAGFVSYHFNDVWAADCSYNNDSKHLVYLLCSLKHIKEKIETLKDGHSAQPHVYCKDVNQFDVPLISDTALKEFELVANTIYQNIKANSEEIKRLQELSTILTLKIGKEV